MPRTGTLIVCVQNLDCSGANQVVLNLVAGKVHERWVNIEITKLLLTIFIFVVMWLCSLQRMVPSELDLWNVVLR
jgi:hypothetical protein